MIDLKLDAGGDLELSETGDVLVTDSIVQAVRIRLLWFSGEWRLMPMLGFPYFESLLVKNPNEAKLRHLIQETVMSVDGVTDVPDVSFSMDKRTRLSSINITFKTDEASFREEVEIPWHSTV